MTEPETCTSSEVYSDLEKSTQETENRKSYSDYNTDTSVSALSVYTGLKLMIVKYYSFFLRKLFILSNLINVIKR